MYCKQCGNFVDENKDKFCMNCGLAVDGEDVKQVEEYKNNLGDTIFYYASETLSIFFLFSFFLDLYYGDETSAVSNILYFVATINMHYCFLSFRWIFCCFLYIRIHGAFLVCPNS